MARRLWLIVVTWLVVLGTAASADAAWNIVGGPLPINGTEGARVPEMVTIDDVPYVAYYGYSPDGDNHEVRVKRLSSLGLWEDVGSGPSPINRAGDQNGTDPSIASVGGVPHVAWLEWDGVNYEARVSRFDEDSGEWEEIVGGASPLNRSSTTDAWFWISIADVGGVPYVAWNEGARLRVSRLDAAGTAWEPVGDSVHHDPARSASYAEIDTIDGVPWVTWLEDDGTNNQVRVARLNGAGDWDEVVGGASPINHDPDGHPIAPALAKVGGVPHVAWSEHDGTNYELRVSRLNAAGTDWEEIVGGASPINHDSGMDAWWTSGLADVGGVPWVTWTEHDGPFNLEVRVSRLSADGSRWEEVVGGKSPMPHAGHMRAQEASITVADGVPYVARVEAGPYVEELRISRLEPDLLSALATVNNLGAILVSKLRTYGVEFPVEFVYGLGSDLGLRTPTLRTARGVLEDTIAQPVTGLVAGSSYSWRPTAFGGSLPLGEPQSFTIPLPEPPDAPDLPAPPDVPDPPPPDPPPLPDLLVSVVDPSLKTLAGRSVEVRYVTTQAADVKLEVRRGKRLVAAVGARSKPGRNRIKWNGRDRGARARPGLYTLTLRAKSAAGAASDSARVRVAHRAVKRRK